MITNKQFDYFSVLVIGENPEEQISKFDEMADASEPYILYSYKDRSKYRKLQIEVYKTYLKSTKDLQSRNLLINKINELKNILSLINFLIPSLIKGRYQSGQLGQTVNLLAYAFVGSNPALPTMHET